MSLRRRLLYGCTSTVRKGQCGSSTVRGGVWRGCRNCSKGICPMEVDRAVTPQGRLRWHSTATSPPLIWVVTIIWTSYPFRGVDLHAPTSETHPSGCLRM